MEERDRLCSLTMDEMSITSKFEYDLSSKQVLGSVNLPNHKGVATHGLVFMLSGICLRWKQTVAFYYTGNFCFNYLHCFKIHDFLFLLML